MKPYWLVLCALIFVVCPGCSKSPPPEDGPSAKTATDELTPEDKAAEEKIAP